MSIQEQTKPRTHLTGLQNETSEDLLTELAGRFNAAVFLFDPVIDSRFEKAKGETGFRFFGSIPSTLGLCHLAGLQVPVLTQKMLAQTPIYEGESDAQDSD